MDVRETLELVKKVLQQGPQQVDTLRKAVTEGQVLSGGEYGYDLAPAVKNLIPINTPIRNRIPRVKGKGTDATRWKVITSMTGSGYSSMGWVPEGQRTDRMVYTTSPKAASYVTFGEEASTTFEAQSAAEGSDGQWDSLGDAHIKNLQMLMLKEESAIIGGNASVSLGKPVLTTNAEGDSGSISATTYYCQVVPLTYEGWKTFNSVAVATGITASKTVYGADGDTYTLNAGVGIASDEGTQSVATGQVLELSAADSNGVPISGAFGYAWYVGTVSGQGHLQSITTLNSVAFKTYSAAGQNINTLTLTADHSLNATYAFDGFLNLAATSANNAYYKALATGTAGTGTKLTPTGKGTVEEIDTMLLTMWNNYQLSPSVLYAPAQQFKDIDTACLNSSSGPLLRINTQPGEGHVGMSIGGDVGWYYNPFHMNGIKIPIKIHPNLPKGTLLAWAEDLPIQYQNNNVPQVAEMHCRRDYYAVDFARKSRRYEFGTYCEAVLACYAPIGIGVITNISDGVTGIS